MLNILNYIAERDPYENLVVYLCHWEGANGAQTFDQQADSIGSYPAISAWTVTGNGTGPLVVNDTSRSMFGSSSLRIGATSGGQTTRLATPSSGTTPVTDPYRFGTRPFTVELGFWPDSITVSNIIDMRPVNTPGSNGFALYTLSDGTLYVYSNGNIMNSAAGAITTGGFNVIAYSRTDASGGAGFGRLFKNGAVIASGTDNNNYNFDGFGGDVVYIPSWTNNSGTYANCNYDEVRITMACRYTGAYTIATTPFPNPP
jgi:hypothetical protein